MILLNFWCGRINIVTMERLLCIYLYHLLFLSTIFCTLQHTAFIHVLLSLCVSPCFLNYVNNICLIFVSVFSLQNKYNWFCMLILYPEHWWTQLLVLGVICSFFRIFCMDDRSCYCKYLPMVYLSSYISLQLIIGLRVISYIFSINLKNV